MVPKKEVEEEEEVCSPRFIMDGSRFVLCLNQCHNDCQDSNMLTICSPLVNTEDLNKKYENKGEKDAPVMKLEISHHMTKQVSRQVLTITKGHQVPRGKSGKPQSKCGKYSSIVWHAFTSHLGMVFLLTAYSFFGAAVFNVLESEDGEIPADPYDLCKTMDDSARLEAQNSVISDFFSQLNSSNINGISQEQLQKVLSDYDSVLLYKDTEEAEDEDEETENLRWPTSDPYWKWLLFCLTCYTTIGYGHIVPATATGKVACMVYSLFGIPLFLMTAGKMGRLLTRALKLLRYWLQKLYYLKWVRRARKTCSSTRANPRNAVSSVDFDWNQNSNRVASCNHHEQHSESSAKHQQNHDGSKDSAFDSNSYHVESLTDGDLKGRGINRPQNENSSVTLEMEKESSFSVSQDTTCHLSSSDGGYCSSGSSNPDSISLQSFEPFTVDDNYNLSPLVSITIMAIYIFIGAGMYWSWEKQWTYLDSVYFVFISISTIGFGDIVPTQTYFFLLTTVYVVFGLSLVAMVINTLMASYSNTFEEANKGIMHFHMDSRHYAGIRHKKKKKKDKV